jgi:predicted  nucleic acid-binding Zn-ribbon protein
MSDDAYILCIRCRSTFTKEQTRGHSGCPTCGSKGVPADTREKATLTLTHHEWRILFVWADNWAGQCDRQDENLDACGALTAIAREARRQAPNFPSVLSMLDEVQDLANTFGKVEVHQHGETTIVEPEKKH